MNRPLAAMLASALALLNTGCGLKDHLDSFTPTRGNVCDQVTINGTIYIFGTLDGVWFNGVKSQNASVIANNGTTSQLHIQATVPPGATTGPLRAVISTSGFESIFVTGTDQTFTPGFTVVGSPAPPVINSFTAASSPIRTGSADILSWAVSSPLTGLTITPGVGGVLSNIPAQAIVHPTSTTTYTLTAVNACLAPVSKTVTVDVVQNLSASVSPSTVFVTPGNSATIPVTISKDLVPVTLTCQPPSGSGLTCNNVTVPTGGTSPPSPLTVTANANASYSVSASVPVAASEQAPGTETAFAPSTIKVGRAIGPFQIVNFSLPPVNSSLTGGACKVTILAGGTGTPQQFQAHIVCGTQAPQNSVFSQGGTFNQGGVGFSQNNALVVVASHDVSPNNNIGFKPFFASNTGYSVVTQFAYDVSTNSVSSSEPEFWASPDGTVAIVTGTNRPATTTTPKVLSIVDLTTNSNLATGLTYQNNFTAQVITTGPDQYVSISLDGGAAKTYKIN